MSANPTFLLIDGHSLAFRTYYAFAKSPEVRSPKFPTESIGAIDSYKKKGIALRTAGARHKR